jgi:hypothetical protein
MKGKDMVIAALDDGQVWYLDETEGREETWFMYGPKLQVTP